MADYSLYIAAVVQALSDDATLSALVDFLVPGFQRGQADRYLQGNLRACVGVRTLNLNSQGFPGCAYHGLSDHDQLIEFDIIQLADNDSGVAAIADAIEQIMKKPISKTIGGITYGIVTVGPIRFMPVNDPSFPNWVEVTGTARLRYIDE